MGQSLKVGDTIKCKDAKEAISYMKTLTSAGYQTDFMYEKDGESGIWIVIENGVSNIEA